MRSKWDEMYRALVAFQEEQGHCNVSAADAEHRRLGQWVSSQRYKYRIGSLARDRVEALDRIGFTWSAADQTWRKMFTQLEEYAAANHTTDIPERYPENQKLSNWVHNQRHRKKIGRLDPKRVEALEKIGFCWDARSSSPEEGAGDDPDGALAASAFPDGQERLYRIRDGVYVQYAGNGPRPRALDDYAKINAGEDPAYIPLPTSKVIFILGNEFYGGRRIPWSGNGALPAEVMRHVEENGTLPHYEPETL